MDDYSIKLGEDSIYELYLDDKLIYKSEDFVYLFEFIARYETFKSGGDLIDICNRYIDNYKKVISLCQKVIS